MTLKLDVAARQDLNRLMRRLADGDRAAFQPVFTALWPRVVRWCAQVLGHLSNEHDAEDVAQQAMLKLFRQAHHFEKEGDVLSWALTLALWECRSHKRTLLRRTKILRKDNIVSEGEAQPVLSPEQIVLNHELHALLEEWVGALSQSDQEVLRLFQNETEAPFSTSMRKRKERAIARLKSLWRKQWR